MFAFGLLKEISKEPVSLKKIPAGANVEFVETDFAKRETVMVKNKRHKYIGIKNVFDIS